MIRITALGVLSLVLFGPISCGDDGESGSGPTAEVTSVSVSPSELTLPIGESEQLTATPRDQAGNVDDGMGKSMTTTTLKDDVYAFIFSQKGLMAGLGVQGNKIAKITPK